MKRTICILLVLVLAAGMLSVGASAASSGWVWSNGWRYQNADGSMAANQWIDSCYLDANGAMVTGWQYINGSWYYFDANGYMQTGWQYVGGDWYYLGTDGRMYSSRWCGDCYLSDSGAMVTGWRYIDGAWYYFDSNGYKQTGWQYIGGYWYYLGTDGKMYSSQWYDGYYLTSGGAMATGWQYISDGWYYFNSSGLKQYGWIYADGNWYFLDVDTGKMCSRVFISDSYGNVYYVNYNGEWVSNSSSLAKRTAAANEVAKDIADYILADSSLTTDLQRVQAAASIVYNFYVDCEYTMSGSYYNTPYGVFIGGQASCAGSVRALGLVLSYMGYSWTHVNENQYFHQWVELYMDGQWGWADSSVYGYGGAAGYGDYPFM